MIKYPQKMRELVKSDNSLRLITISAPCLEFQGPVPIEEAELLQDYLLKFLQRRHNLIGKEKV